MASFNMNEADNYGGNANCGSFFTLKDDKDKANVRFLYRTMDDVEGHSVHRVQVGDKERYVNCIREYNEPLDKCPFCAAQLKVQARLFVKLYNEDSKECQIWERSKAYFQRLAGLANHFNPLCDEVIEVCRNGKKGDTNTTYDFFPINNSPIDLDDEQYQCAEPLGTIILDKSAEDMEVYLSTGSFPETNNNGSSNSSHRDNLDTVQRRTPSNNPPRRAF